MTDHSEEIQTGEINPNLPPPYPKLKTSLVEKIRKKRPRVFDEVANEFIKIGIETDGYLIRELMAEGITNSQPDESSGWGAGIEGRGPATIGFYKNEIAFNMTLLHEIGHMVIGTNPQAVEARKKLGDDKEDFCWDFSRKLCQILKISYDERIDKFLRNFYERLGSIPESDLEAFDAIIEKEREIIGYSNLDADPFSFTPEGSPILIQPEASV